MDIYLALLGRALRGGGSPAPGKVSRVASRISRTATYSDVPGRNSRTSRLADDVAVAGDRQVAPAVSASERRAAIVDDDPQREERTRALLADLTAALGLAPDAVVVRVDEDARRKTIARGARGLQADGAIYLNPDEYDPATAAGRRLLAHETIHVAQRQLSPVPGTPVASRRAAEGEAGYVASRFATGHAVSRPVMALPGYAAAADNDEERELRGKKVQEFGRAYKREGVNLRDKPAPDPISTVRKTLAFNTRMFVDSEDNGYYFVTTDNGDFGYVIKTHVKTGLPEPAAKIYYIQSGDTALGISRKHYGGKAEWGRDHRFFVNGLVYVNQGQGKRGIYKPDPDADWDTTQVRADYMIWVPSLAFMRSLQGKVGSGSITHDAWEGIKRAAYAVGEFLLGSAAFIAGLLHGVLESLWDILIGLKDLAVMAWDILKSLVTGNLLGDAEGLWEDLKNLDWEKLVQGWLDDFSAKWNHESLLRKWHFRGWVVGYVIAEVVMLVFSGGIIQGIKWAGKAAKVAKVVAKFPRIGKFAKAAKENKAAQKLIRGLSRGGGSVSKSARAAKAFVEGLLSGPKSIWGKGPDEIAQAFRKAGFEATIQQSTKGSKLSKQIRIKGHKEIGNIQVHPGGGRHGGSYYKISTSTRGKIKVVDRATYRPIPGEKATIVFVDSGLSGWLARAVVANSAAQRAGREDDDD